ncbi:MAG TPA: TonB-dependent receptor [Saprospiraceae bacterium]|nr:TonB-dependent receptor [Saprospiraceae bacterium]HMQ81935.1 TonB-dependent receptor [Saprospiraceae bacterium]
MTKYIFPVFTFRFLLPILIVGSLALSTLTAQTPVQTIRGRVLDADTQEGLAGCTVYINAIDRGTFSDSLGYFRLETIPIGRYEVQFSYLGYEVLNLAEVLVESGKESVLQVELVRNATQLETVEISSGKTTPIGSLPMRVKSITVEATQRYPATFYDPARLATALPGVANADDQANGLVIRGLPPSMLSWYLEGVEILNPNHTANAGTRSDRITPNSGGVNSLSSQLLATSYLHNGAFSTEYGNAISGVMDMRLRAGNNEKTEYTLQAGLIGLDVAAEGPISRKKGSSFLVNYRYSTVGLLTSLGVDFGEETINFQDISANVVFPGKRSRLSLFVLGGNSKNEFTGSEDPSLWENAKDASEVNFYSRLGVAGMNYQRQVGTGGRFAVKAAYSMVDYERYERQYDIQAESNDKTQIGLFSTQVSYAQLLGKSTKLTAGLNYNQWSPEHFWDYRDALDSAVSNINYELSLLTPFVGFRQQLAKAWLLQGGLRAVFYDSVFEDTYWLEPRLELSFTPSTQDHVSLAYGLSGQIQNIYYHQALPRNTPPNKANQLVLGYERQFPYHTSLSVEVFYYWLFDVASYLDLNQGILSVLNDLQPEAIRSSLTPDVFFYKFNNTSLSEIKNYGLDISYKRLMNDGFFYTLNASIFDVQYRFEQSLSARYDARFVSSAVAGKEWLKTKSEDKTTGWGFNLSAYYRGGFRELTFIGLTDNQPIYETPVFNEVLPNFFRLDMRLYRKWNRKQYNTSLALDIQNLSNYQNVAYTYYDRIKGEVVERYQLSLIPILTYRVSL